MTKELKCNYCGADVAVEHDCVDVLNQKLREEKRLFAAALNRVEELEAEVERLNKILTNRVNGIWEQEG